MVLLIEAALLGGLGVILFGIGLATDNQSLILVGAIMVIVLGGVGMSEGIEVKVGQNDIDTASGNDSFRNVYEPIDDHTGFPVGFVVILIGLVMMVPGART